MSKTLDQNTQTQIEDAVESVFSSMIASIKEAVCIRSDEGPAERDAPFGPGPRQALEHALQTAANLGFTTKNLDGYAGYAEWSVPGSDGYVAAVGHVDVVPAGTSGWKNPPYSGYEEDGVIYSRGVLDNKGPIYSCLYALAALKNAGITPKRSVRIVFGCNEETGMRCMRHYLKVEDAPVMGFTPDCKFPVVYAERGRATYRLVGKLGDHDAFFEFLNEYILNAKPNGERFGIDFTDDEFGTLEVRNYRVENKDNTPAATFVVSYPANLSSKEICERIAATVHGTGVVVEQTSDIAPVRFERDSELVQALTLAYERSNTGYPAEPVTTTGGTYAKIVPNIVPFGPSFPGQKGIGHQPNEWMKIEDLRLCAKIYALGLYLISQ